MSPNASKRLFIGIPIPAELQALLHRLRPILLEADQQASLRWVAPANYHITLEFLGQTAWSTLPLLSSVMTAAIGECAATRLALDTVALFPDLRKPRVLALLPCENPALIDLRESLAAALRGQGFPVAAGRYRPHLTLARIRGRKAPVLKQQKLRPIELPVDCVALFESVSGDGPVRYQILHRLSLR